MKKISLFISFFIIIHTLLSGQSKLTADPEKTTLSWLGEKVTGQHTGSVKLQSGWLSFKDNMVTAGEFLIDMTSIKDVDSNERLDTHLKSDDFFSVEKFPVSTLTINGSDSFEKGSATVRGDLTIKGITNPIEFRAAMQKKDDGVWFYANIVVDRTKYNVRYGSGSFFDNLGDRTIYDEFKIKVALLMK
jgi:polyisoprenoid-binding protein YceI